MGNSCCSCGECFSFKSANLSKNSGQTGGPHILLCGPTGSGKTTLMFRTLLPGWNSINEGMQHTLAFHYEEHFSSGKTLGIWDLSGSEAVAKSWCHLYHSVQLQAVLFVLSLVDTDTQRLLSARKTLQRLLSDGSLQQSSIHVIVNSFACPTEVETVYTKNLISQIGLLQLKEEFGSRISWHIVDAKDGILDPNWKLVVNSIMGLEGGNTEKK